MESRLDILKQMVEQEPDDDFSRYGLALEYKKLGQTDDALAQFSELRQRHPDYVAGYFMAGQMLSELDRTDEARTWLEDGIGVAKRVGDQHALAEMEEYLEQMDV